MAVMDEMDSFVLRVGQAWLCSTGPLPLYANLPSRYLYIHTLLG